MKLSTLDIKPVEVVNDAGVKMQVADYPALIDLDADVYLIFGMRSFGKSYGILKYVIDRWEATEGKETFVYMRTIEDDVLPSKSRKYIATIKNYFNELVNYEKELTVYNGDIIARWIDEKQIKRQVIGSGMSLSGWLKYKGNNYDTCQTVIFEEFLERKPKLSNVDFMDGLTNNLSTIIRFRPGVKVFYLANTVRKKSPVFDYYNIDIKRVKKGVPVLFQEENGLKVCVYWTPDVNAEEQEAAKHYTVGQTRQAKMITSGQWEENSYPDQWNGFSFPGLLSLKAYRKAATVYFSDLQCYMILPILDSKRPILFTKRRLKRLATKTTLQASFLRYTQLMRKVHDEISIGNVVSDGCNDLIDMIRDKIL